MSKKRHGPPPREEWDSLPRTAAEAREVGSPWYKPDRLCKNGHDCVYRTGNQTCYACSQGHAGKWYDANMRPDVEARRAKREAERPAREAARKAKREAERPARLAALKLKRKERMGEEGTDDYRAEEARQVREKYWADPERQRERVRKRHRSGRSGYRSERLRTPPWLTADELFEIERIYEDRPDGYEVDHIVDRDRLPLVAGLHVPWNLQYLTKVQDRKKPRTCTMGQAAEYVRLGMAVWKEDIGPDGTIDWDKYPRPAARVA
jgi:hypothetical protein